MTNRPARDDRGVVLMWPEDLRALNFCNKVARPFFAAHRLNWQDFLQHGLAVDKLEALNEPRATRAAAQAKKRVSACGK